MITLTHSQGKAVGDIGTWFDCPYQPFYYLAGFAGTGKSTILPHIINECGSDIKVAFVAPTAKAAKVMGEKLRIDGIYSMTRTIHSWIVWWL